MAPLRPKTTPARGVLRSDPETLPIAVTRFEPPADLAPFVEHFWIVRWDLRAHGPRTQEVLPHPSIHWVNEYPRSEIQGIVRGRFTRVLRGRGQVHSVKFRPGGFSAFVDTPMHRFTGKRSSAVRVLGPVLRGVAARVRDCSDAEAVDLLTDVLRRLEPTPDPAARRAGEIVLTIAADHEIISVAQVCARSDISRLNLQRLFRRKIGVSPKWVIQRYRLHEVVERIHALPPGESPPWAALAVDLGFTDQAHFARTFRAFVGVSPGHYVKRLRSGAAAAAHAS